MKYFLTEPWYKLRSIFTSKIDVLEILQKIESDGIFICRNYLDASKCDYLINTFNKNLNHKNIWRDELNSDTRMYGVERLDKSFDDIFDVAILNKTYNSYISNVMNSIILCNHVVPVGKNKGSGGGWHRDSINRRQLKFILYLTDSSEKTGCFQYIRKSHFLSEKYKINKKLGLKTDEYRYEDEQIDLLLKERATDLISVEGKKGDLIIADTSGIHRGKPIEKEERYAVTKYMWDTSIPNHIKDLLV